MVNSTRNMLSKLSLKDSKQEDVSESELIPVVPVGFDEPVPPVNKPNYAANLEACLAKNPALDPKLKS